MLSTKLLLIFGIITYMGCSVHSLQCYVCDEQQKAFSQNCDDDDLEPHELEALKMDCNNVTQIVPPKMGSTHTKPEATGCVELIVTKQKVSETVKDKTLTIRTCFFGDADKSEQECKIDPKNIQNGIIDEHMRCDVCFGDLCNSSTMNTPITLGILLSVFIAYIAFFK